jgi:hypothetical protein
VQNEEDEGNKKGGRVRKEKGICERNVFKSIEKTEKSQERQSTSKKQPERLNKCKSFPGKSDRPWKNENEAGCKARKQDHFNRGMLSEKLGKKAHECKTDGSKNAKNNGCRDVLRVIGPVHIFCLQAG